MAVESPLGTGVDEPVEGEGLEDEIPARSLAARRQVVAPENVEAELLPEFAAEPAGTPLAGLAQGHGPEMEAHDRQIGVGSFDRCVFVGEEQCLLRCGAVLTGEMDGFAPRAFLVPVEFTQVEDVTLKDSPVMESPVFHDAPVEVLFAILEPFRATKKHDG